MSETKREGRTTATRRIEIGQESTPFGIVASIVAGTRRQVSLAVDGDYEKSTRVERQQCRDNDSDNQSIKRRRSL